MKSKLIHIALFLTTALTTFYAGYLLFGEVLDGLLFSSSLLLILGTHELGHYHFGKKNGVDITPPYFIPVPALPDFPTIGTFGAFIRIRSPIYTKRALFDIGIAGPLMGILMAVPVIAIGLRLSSVVANPPDAEGGLLFGAPIFYTLLETVFLSDVPKGSEVIWHPMAFAGWIGFLVTALNLIPAGQLDGGHIMYALFTKQWHRRISAAIVVVLIVLGVGTKPFVELAGLVWPESPLAQYAGPLLFGGWPGWVLWAFLLSVFGRKHPPTIYDTIPLDRKRKMLGIVGLVVFLGCFTPVPVSLIP
ncbi:MAG: site-2 protease family protein [Candidatus Dadabacteria bacterium]|nr:site-2 protease family protein [Candidatus Dadabacteria bacterium]